ncbi:MAG: thiamine phosphate synthase [Candidatus Krumholzibacteriota bacterium]|nr:thiamine phosphate synthase [Candidatus Krumholzibacteriota bacterium]
MDNRKKTIFRIIDANANRCCEGLRVIEEIVRFDDEDISFMAGIKELRHSIRRLAESISNRLVDFRKSDDDVGALFSTVSEKSRGSFSSVARANFLRVEEGLRVIEEFGKLVAPEISQQVKDLRFRVYSAERTFFGSEIELPVMPSSPFLYAFIDRAVIGAPEVEKTADDLVAGGAGMIQYRAKGISRDEMRIDIIRIISAASRKKIPVIINDEIDLAAETGAAGVHLGQDDAGPAEAREVLGPRSIVGLSIRTMKELRHAPGEILDYVAVSGVFPTGTKKGVKPLGLGFLARVCEKSAIPVVAIGGITTENAGSVLETGADGIAVISAILNGDARKNSFTFSQIIDKRNR